MEIHLLDIIIHIINIGVLYFLLRLILYKPIKKFLRARTERVQGQLEEAEKMQQEAAQNKVLYEKKIQESKEQAHAIMFESTQKATEAAEDIMRDAKQRADMLMENAHDKIGVERTQVLSEMQGQIIDIATQLAARILRREVNKEDNAVIAREFFREGK
jgi:F-type H+-transporting ATPase subunit b